MATPSSIRYVRPHLCLTIVEYPEIALPNTIDDGLEDGAVRHIGIGSTRCRCDTGDRFVEIVTKVVDHRRSETVSNKDLNGRGLCKRRSMASTLSTTSPDIERNDATENSCPAKVGFLPLRRRVLTKLDLLRSSSNRFRNRGES